jgi:hypothetical protein
MKRENETPLVLWVLGIIISLIIFFMYLSEASDCAESCPGSHGGSLINMVCVCDDRP